METPPTADKGVIPVTPVVPPMPDQKGKPMTSVKLGSDWMASCRWLRRRMRELLVPYSARRRIGNEARYDA